MADQARPAPHTAEQRQAVATVYAIREVYAEIEELAEMLRDVRMPMIDRVDAKHDLAQASDRLCNLMVLAVHQLEHVAEGQLRDHLEHHISHLKIKLMRMSAKLMVEKLEKIDERAMSVLKDNDYPIGLSSKLDLAFANLMSNLRVLGGAERLGEKVPELVSKTETNLKSLNEKEKKLGVLVDLQLRKTPRG